MLLLNTHTLRLETFADNQIPKYAILSHVWGRAQDEVSFEHMRTDIASQQVGYFKLRRSSAVALQDGLKYIWIDTCCIDKSSSAELSEAINSMFRYYKNAEICYAYLIDVPSSAQDATFAQSKWVTRGWTLQELIAPRRVKFLSKSWLEIGTKDKLANEISQITKVDVKILSDSSQLHQASIAQRMCWASTRETTREEDIAYCLLGIFDVNMPLLYGEGKKAFLRLQQEIMKGSTDQSLFAWTPSVRTRDAMAPHVSVLAQCPADFQEASHIVRNQTNPHPYAMTNKGLQITVPITSTFGEQKLQPIAILSCHEEGQFKSLIGIELEGVYGEENVYFRKEELRLIGESERQKATSRQIYLVENKSTGSRYDEMNVWVRTIPSENFNLHLRELVQVASSSSEDSWAFTNRTTIWSTREANPRSAVIFDHPSGSKVVVSFGVNSLDRPDYLGAPVWSISDEPWVDIVLLPKSQDGTTTCLFDPEWSVHTSSQNAMAYTPSGHIVTAAINVSDIMGEEIIVVDILTEDPSTIFGSYGFVHARLKLISMAIEAFYSVCLDTVVTVVFIFLEHFLLRGEDILRGNSLWENRWDNFLFAVPSQRFSPTARHLIPYVVPLYLYFHFVLRLYKIWISFMEFLLRCYKVLVVLLDVAFSSSEVLVLQTFVKSIRQFVFWLPPPIAKQFRLFFHMFDSIDMNALAQDGFWLCYYLQMNGFNFVSRVFTQYYDILVFLAVEHVLLLHSVVFLMTSVSWLSVHKDLN